MVIKLLRVKDRQNDMRLAVDPCLKHMLCQGPMLAWVPLGPPQGPPQGPLGVPRPHYEKEWSRVDQGLPTFL